MNQPVVILRREDPSAAPSPPAPGADSPPATRTCSSTLAQRPSSRCRLWRAGPNCPRTLGCERSFSSSLSWEDLPCSSAPLSASGFRIQGNGSLHHIPEQQEKTDVSFYGCNFSSTWTQMCTLVHAWESTWVWQGSLKQSTEKHHVTTAYGNQTVWRPQWNKRVGFIFYLSSFSSLRPNHHRNDATSFVSLSLFGLTVD